MTYGAVRTVSLYDAVSGAFNGTVVSSGSDDCIAANTPAGFVALDGQYDYTAVRFDIPSGAVVARSACPISSSVAGRVVTLTGVPAGATYAITGNAILSGTVDSSGTLALTFGAPGTYNVAIPCFPLLDYSGSFTLT